MNELGTNGKCEWQAELIRCYLRQYHYALHHSNAQLDLHGTFYRLEFLLLFSESCTDYADQSLIMYLRQRALYAEGFPSSEMLEIVLLHLVYSKPTVDQSIELRDRTS